MKMPTAEEMIAFICGLPGRFMKRSRFVLKIVPIPRSIIMIPSIMRI